MDHENQGLSPTVSQSGEPQEVVLRYEAPVTPIVERYVQPTPLPGQPKKKSTSVAAASRFMSAAGAK